MARTRQPQVGQVATADGKVRAAARSDKHLASSEGARDINRDIVLELLRTHQPIARVELAKRSGLQRSTISSIVDQLIGEHWVSEGAARRTARGRRPTMLTLNEEMAILVADVRPTHATLAVMDLRGRFLSREIVPLIPDPVLGVRAIVQGMQRLRTTFADKRFEGIGISLPGRVDTRTHRLIMAPNLKWKDFGIKEAIEAETHLQVDLDNAANACMMSELWFGRLDGVVNAVLLTISEGVGAAILANGQLVQGEAGLAGEFGHISVDPTGPLCACGQCGCWEVFASSRAALRFYAEEYAEGAGITIQELFNRVASGDEAAVSAVEKQARNIGRGLRMVTAALNPEVILFAGDITASWAQSGPLIEAEMTRTMLGGAVPRLISIGDGEMARLRGAAAMVLQRHSGYHRSVHTRSPGRAMVRVKVTKVNEGNTGSDFMAAGGERLLEQR